MKVVLLASTPPPVGGISVWTERMLKTKLKNNWSIKLVDEKVLGNRDAYGKVRKNLIIEAKRCFIIWRDLWKALNDDEAKIVHSCIPAYITSMLREYVCAIISKMRRRPFILHFRCTIPNMVTTKLSLFMFKRICSISSRVLVLNSTSKEFVESYSKTISEIIPNFIEDSIFLETKKREISGNINTVLYVGGVIKEKGCDDIINVAKDFPEIEFRLVGHPSDEIIKMKKTDNVTICGELDKKGVQLELQKADVFMFVSHYAGEGFSNALVEAMANGLPCIVSDWAANKDMIEDHGGYVVQIKDIEGMKKALKSMSNKTIREYQSAWNINKVMNEYKEELITVKYIDTYEAVLR